MTTKAELQKKVDELKAQIDAMEDDKPAVHTCRVMGVDELEMEQDYFVADSDDDASVSIFGKDAIDSKRIAKGNAFYDRESAGRSRGGSIVYRITDYKLFGFILLYRVKEVV